MNYVIILLNHYRMNTVNFLRRLTEVHGLSLSIMQVLYHQNGNISKAGSTAVFKHNVTQL